jgi:excisionase family DNA binding protein
VNGLPTDPDALLTYEQVAKLLDVDKKTVRRMVEEGDFPSPMKIGKQIRWRTVTVREFFAALELITRVKNQASKEGQTGSFEGQPGTNDPETPIRPSKTKKSD